MIGRHGIFHSGSFFFLFSQTTHTTPALRRSSTSETAITNTRSPGKKIGGHGVAPYLTRRGSSRQRSPAFFNSATAFMPWRIGSRAIAEPPMKGYFILSPEGVWGEWQTPGFFSGQALVAGVYSSAQCLPLRRIIGRGGGWIDAHRDASSRQPRSTRARCIRRRA